MPRSRRPHGSQQEISTASFRQIGGPADRPNTTPGLRFRFYKTREGANPVREFLDGLKMPDQQANDKARAAIQAAMKEVERGWLQGQVGRGTVKNLGAEMYEIRAAVKGEQFRVLFAREPHTRVLLALHAFEKKTQELPRKEKAVAEDRLRDWRERGVEMRKEKQLQQRSHGLPGPGGS